MAIQRLTASAVIFALAVGVIAQADAVYQGCKAIDTPGDANTELDDPYPVACQVFCNNNSYTYYGVVSFSCACWKDAPLITESYPTDDTDHQSCYFACGEGHEDEYCGGFDGTNNNQLYSFYGPTDGREEGDSGTTSTTATTTSTTVSVSSATATTTASATTTTASTTASVTSTTATVPSSSSVSAAAPTTTSATAAADSFPDYTSTVYATSTNWNTICPKCNPEPTQIVYAASTICYEAKLFTQSDCYSTLTSTCSNGNLETAVVGPTPCVVPYDKALSSVSLAIDGTITQTILVAVPTVVAAVDPAPYANGTANGTVIVKPFVQVGGAGRVVKSGGVMALLVGVVAALL